MPNLAEILAAKKAAASAAPASNPVVMQHPDTGLDVRAKEAAAPVVETVVKTIAEPVKEEPATTAAPKPMSFAEKMALKKAQEQKSEQKQEESVPAPSAISSSAQVAPTPVKEDTGTPTQDEISNETRQAYSDIKEKIALLNSMSGDDLKNAMSNLKKALMANPAAVSLMEDTDIGQMVIGLRKLTGQDIAEASKEKKAGRKPSKQIDLSDPDAVASVLDAL